MSAGRNVVKLITGVALGAGVGALLSRFSERAQEPSEHTAAPGQSLGETAQDWKARLRSRWESANLAGDVAKEAKEAELRARFRANVNDPDALLHEEPVRSQ